MADTTPGRRAFTSRAFPKIIDWLTSELRKQVCLQNIRLADIDQWVLLLPSAIERFPSNGCRKAAGSADVSPPARSCLGPVVHRLVRLCEHQAMEQRLLLLLSASQACPNGARILILVSHVSLPGSGLLLKKSSTFGLVGAQFFPASHLFCQVVFGGGTNLPRLLNSQSGDVS